MGSFNAGLLRFTRSTLASAALVAIVAALAMAYTSGGGASRDSLIAEMLSNFILVLGMQVFIGNTGVLSFGHMAFAQIAAYATAVVGIPLGHQGQGAARHPVRSRERSLRPARSHPLRRPRDGNRWRHLRHCGQSGQWTGAHDDHVGGVVRR